MKWSAADPERAAVSIAAYSAIADIAGTHGNGDAGRPFHDPVVVGDELDRGAQRNAPDVADFLLDHDPVVLDHADVAGLVVVNDEMIGFPDAGAHRHDGFGVDDPRVIDVADLLDHLLAVVFPPRLAIGAIGVTRAGCAPVFRDPLGLVSPLIGADVD